MFWSIRMLREPPLLHQICLLLVVFLQHSPFHPPLPPPFLWGFVCYLWSATFSSFYEGHLPGGDHLCKKSWQTGSHDGNPPFTTFQDIVLQCLHPKFLPKVVSRVHFNQPIHLPTFLPKPHTSNEEWHLHSLSVHRTLASYLQRTKPFWKSPRLLVAIVETIKGQTISTQRISKWVSGCVTLCYQLSERSPPAGIWAHSTSVQASTTSILHSVPLADIRKAATWSLVHTFSSHYALVHDSAMDTSFNAVVLRSTGLCHLPRTLLLHRYSLLITLSGIQ